MGRQFSVRYYKDSPLDLSCMGKCEVAALRISVQDELPLATEQDTLFHEVTHAIEKTLGLDLTELQVNALSAGWVQVLRDNPELAKYLASNR